MNYKEQAESFLKETQFHLGDLTTEQPHSKTKNFSSTIQNDIPEGLKQLLLVDEDIPIKAKEVFKSIEYNKLKEGIKNVINRNGTIMFSGCGSTGRLAIMLESFWRRFWYGIETDNPELKTLFNNRGDRSYSIMTGGDRALIKSVENFEDFISFGRRQSKDSGVGTGDLFIAISEGGETSSVIGTALEAADAGAEVFFLYNNPDEILINKVERSKNIIDDSRITTINLTTGPMALTGSTRMQATTIELLIIGTAMEATCGDIVESELPVYKKPFPYNREDVYVDLFSKFLKKLTDVNNLEVLSKVVIAEQETYAINGFITYISDTYLLDIFSDTTERSPTFMLPPFKKKSDVSSVESWAFAKDPLRNTKDSWSNLLQRAPRGIDWSSEDYKSMNSPLEIIENPPTLDENEILSYPIGFERSNGRYRNGRLILFDLYDNRSIKNRALLNSYFDKEKGLYDLESIIVSVDNSNPAIDLNIDLGLLETEMNLFWHLFFKLILNTVSTGTMGVMERIRGNWMIQVDATNKKLIDRSCRIISSLTGVTYREACFTLFSVMEKYSKESREDNRSYVLLAIDEIENRN